MKKSIAALAVLAVTAFAAYYAHAFPESGLADCRPGFQLRDMVQGGQWKEAPIGRGTTTFDYQAIELLRSKDGGTWTILIYARSGNACILERGIDWTEIEWIDPEGKTH